MIPSGSHRLFRENEFSLCRKHDRCLQQCLKELKRLHVATVPKEQIFQIGGILQLTCKLLRQVILTLCRHLDSQTRKYPYGVVMRLCGYKVIWLKGYGVSVVCLAKFFWQNFSNFAVIWLYGYMVKGLRGYAVSVVLWLCGGISLITP